MKILFAVSCPFPDGGANARRLHTIAKEMVRKGVATTFVIPFSRTPSENRAKIDGIDVKWVYVPKAECPITNKNGRVKLAVQCWSRFLALIELAKHSLCKDYDWLYLYQPGLEGVLAACLARLGGRRVCSEYVDLLRHSSFRGIWWRLIFLTLLCGDMLVPRLSTLVVVISRKLEGHYRRRTNGGALRIVPTLVDCKEFGSGDPDRYRRELGVADAKLVVFTGSSSRPQGLAVLVEAMAKVCQVRDDTYLIVAGSSLAHDRDDPSELGVRFGISRKVLNLGVLTKKDVIDLLAAATVCVLPKLDEPVNHAGLSTKLGEYLAAGRPVVASSVGDVSLYLRHGEDCLLCPPGDPSRLAELILFVAANPKDAARISENGRKAAYRFFDAASNITTLLGHMEDLSR